MQLYGKCIPSGDQYDHLITATYAKTFDIGFYHYYSPGLYCPSNWTTVGKYVKGTGSAAQISGALTKTESEPVPHSEYTLDFNGNCYSVLGDASAYGYSEICGFVIPTTAVPLTSTISGYPVIKYTGPVPVATFTRDMQTGELKGGSLVVSRVPAVALVHHEADFTKASGDDVTKENSGNMMNERSCAMLLLTMVVMATLAISGL
ncbi:hypothetical protein LB505_010447 [Fusarium chuoi]|nr:hypothetical protein LB505_010447 [Fusarium chuoi]